MKTNDSLNIHIWFAADRKLLFTVDKPTLLTLKLCLAHLYKFGVP